MGCDQIVVGIVPVLVLVLVVVVCDIPSTLVGRKHWTVVVDVTMRQLLFVNCAVERDCCVWRFVVCVGTWDSNLVDSASSHTLVSKIKPCISKYNSFTLKTANGSLYQL